MMADADPNKDGNAELLQRPDDEEVAEMYIRVLDHLLTPPHVKDQLVASQSVEKKWQTVKMHQQVFEGEVVGKSHSWGSKDTVLLKAIEKSKTPDIQSLSRLKISLSAANRDYMDGFLQEGGVGILIKAMETRINKTPVTELDVAILYEIMTCCKAIMNNAVGMEGFMTVPGAIETVSRCLRFDFRLFTLQVLEILSVCCYYSDTAASQVVNGMRMLASGSNEAPFACLCTALQHQDIEVKAAIMQFVNSMIMGVADPNAHALLRSDLDSVLLGHSYDQAVKLVDKELEILPTLLGEDDDDGEGEEDDAFDAATATSSTDSPSSSAKRLAPQSPERTSVVSPPPTKGKSKHFSFSIGGNSRASASGSSPSAMGRVSTFGRPSLAPAAASASSPHSAHGLMRSTGSAGGSKALKRRSLTVLHGPRAISQQKVDAMLQGKGGTLPGAGSPMGAVPRGSFAPGIVASNRLTTSGAGGAVAAGGGGALGAISEGTEMEVVSANGNITMTVNPLEGSMAGLLVASKNFEKLETKVVVDMFGGKKTKRRWYEVDQDYFKWCAGHDKEDEYKGFVAVASITDIRNYTTDANLLSTNPNSFEFETTDRVYALGCEDAADKDNWITALRVSRDNCIMRNGAYKIQSRELSEKDVYKFTQMFKKQGAVYQSILVEDRKALTVESGLDMSDINAVSHFLRSEALAAGHQDLLLSILHQLLLIPTGARGTWQAAQAGLQRLVERSVGGGRDSKAGELAFGNESVTTLLNEKGTDGGGQYSQMSKLAMQALVAEQNSTRLQASVDDLLAQVRRLEDEVVQAKANGGSATAATTTAATTTSATAAADSAGGVTDTGVDAATIAELRTQVTQLDNELSQLRLNGATGTTSAMPGPPSLPPPAADAAAVHDERYEKYVKMKKMLPEGAVRQKMMADGFSDAEIDSFMANGPPMVGGAAAPAASASVPDERYEKYVKMKKMLPEGAVRQKMMADGFSDAEIDSFMANGPPMVGGAAAVGGAARPPPPPKLSPAEAIKFAKYEKMLKMLPEGAVRQKMAADELSEEEIVKFFATMGGGAAGGGGGGAAAKKRTVPKTPEKELPPEGMVEKPKITPGAKMKGIFWCKLKSSEVPGTLWHKLPDFNLPAEDIAKLEEMFAAKVTAAGAGVGGGAGAGAGAGGAVKAKDVPKLTSVLDGKRTQNISIIMGKVRRSPEQILQLIIELDPEVLTAELSQTLYEILPTSEELEAIKPHKDPKQLDGASQLLFQFNRLPRILPRVECHQIAFAWKSNADHTANRIGVVDCACKELQRSEGDLRQVLAMVLALGNYLNGGTPRGQAYGVKLDVLPKLANLKSQQSTSESLVHFLGLEVEKRCPALMNLSEKWVAIWAAADISLKQLNTEVMQLDAQINKLNSEFTRIKDTRENIGLDGKLEDAKGPAMNPLHRRLSGFLIPAKPRIAGMKTQIKTVEAAVEKEMQKYGESMKTVGEGDPSQNFFSAIATFARNFRTAIDENIAKRVEAEKAAQAALEAAQKSSMKKAAAVGAFAAAGKAGKAAAGGRAGKADNIFGMFHSAQEASSDDVVAEFKAKLAQRMMKSNQ